MMTTAITRRRRMRFCVAGLRLPSPDADCTVPARRERNRNRAQGPDTPGPHLDAAKLLGGAGLRAAAALRCRDGRWYVPPRDNVARAGPQAVACSLCAAFAATVRRPLWRESQ